MNGKKGFFLEEAPCGPTTSVGGSTGFLLKTPIGFSMEVFSGVFWTAVLKRINTPCALSLAVPFEYSKSSQE
jgi:hypothetical protein